MEKISLSDLRKRSGNTLTSAAKLCGVSLKTWRRYEQEKAPAWAMVMFQALSGNIGTISTTWAGWTLSPRDGKLYDESNDEYSTGYLRSFWFRNQQAQDNRSTMKALRRKIDRLEKQLAEKNTAPDEAANDSNYSDSKKS